jgi:hypothetical protein
VKDLLKWHRSPAATIVGRERAVRFDGDAHAVLKIRMMDCQTGADEEYVHGILPEVAARCSAVVAVELLTTAHLRRLPSLLSIAPHLQMLHVNAPRIREWGGACQLVALREASLMGFSEPTSQLFAPCTSIESFRLESPASSFTRFAHASSVVWIRGARHLIDFADLRAVSVCLEASNPGLLMELPKVRGLRVVDLLGMRSLADLGLGFLDRCPDLAEVVVLSSGLSRIDLSPLIRSSVKNAYVQLSDAALRELSGRWPSDGVLTNGRIGFSNGRLGPGDFLWSQRTRVGPSIYDRPQGLPR